MKTCMSTAVLLAVIAQSVSSASAASLTFEEFLGFDEAPIGTFYSGITFQGSSSGSDWVARDATSGRYNISSWPSGNEYLDGEFWINDMVGATTALDDTGYDGIIAFDNEDATYLELNYTAGTVLILSAYDTNDNLLDSVSGPANRRHLEGNDAGPGTLRVEWDGYARISRAVIVGTTGDSWIVDNILTDATGISVPDPTIPLPPALPQALLLLSLLGGFTVWRRK
jgi:hypothetical protein